MPNQNMNSRFRNWLGNNWFNRTPVPPTPVPPTPVPPTPVFSESLIKLLKIHNAERSRKGAKPLMLEIRLSTAAQRHAEWMANNQQMSHRGEKGSSHVDRISDEGYSTLGSGENIAMGFSSETEVMEGWMDSPGHKANILNKGWKETGFGVYEDIEGHKWWCAVFATPPKSTFGSNPSDVLEVITPDGITASLL